MTSLLEIAETLTGLGILVIPLKMDRKPFTEWKDRREKPLEESEIIEWFTPNKAGKCRATGIAFALRGKGVMFLLMDVDGREAKDVFENEFLPYYCSKTIRKAFMNTSLTRTLNDGFHYLIEIKPAEFPDGIKQSIQWSQITIETSTKKEGNKHSQINLLGTEFMTREYGPGYVTVKEISNRSKLSKKEIEPMLEGLKQFKKDTFALRVVADQLKPYYKQPNRDRIVFHTSGFLWKYGAIPKELTIRLFRHIIRVTAYEDEDIDKTIATIELTYSKDKSEVSGRESMLAALDSNNAALAEIEQAFKQLNPEYFPGVSANGKEHNYQEEEDNNSATLEEPGNVWGSDTIAPSILTELDRHKWSIKSHNGPVFYVAHSGLNSIVDMLQYDYDIENEDQQKMKIYKIQIRETYIHAIPIEVTIYEDPINPNTIERLYKIKFRTNRKGRILTTPEPMTIDNIMIFLNSHALIALSVGAKNALSSIINTFERKDEVKISREIEAPGFFLVDGKLKASHIEIKEHSVEEIKVAAEFVNALVGRYHRTDVISTTIHWGVIAPCNYALKQHTGNICYIQWLGLSGSTQVGKTTYGRICCGIWGYYDSQKYNIVFASVNTPATLGIKLSQSGLPLNISETEELCEDYAVKLREMIKGSIQGRVSRSKYISRTTYADIPCLPACIFSSNLDFPTDSGYRGKFIYMTFTANDRFWTMEQQVEFSAFVSAGLKHLKVLGDYAAKCLLEEQTILLKEKVEESNWREAATVIMRKFYETAGLEIPNWVGLFVKEVNTTTTALEDARESSYYQLVAMFQQAVIDGYRKDPKWDSEGKHIEVGFENKLSHCLQERLIPYLWKVGNRIIITQDVMNEIRRRKIPNIYSMASLAEEISGFTHGSIRIDGSAKRAVYGSCEDFDKFIKPTIEFVG